MIRLGDYGIPMMFALSLATGLPAGATAQHDHSPYEDHTGREIAALSPDDVEALRAGEGMGYALAAELNGYPGPRHVLDLGAELDLSERQRTAVEDVFQRMRSAAVDLGEELVAAERALDELFASGSATEDDLDRLTREAASLEGRLRAIHLRAHLETADLLAEEQIEAYRQLRGYGEGHDAGGSEP
ncbi:MAG: Spy/CpxP family protein refolding chaperone [Gemmatimonadota bacterium]